MHSLNLPHWMWDVGVIFMPYSCSGFILVGCPNGSGRAGYDSQKAKIKAKL